MVGKWLGWPFLFLLGLGTCQPQGDQGIPYVRVYREVFLNSIEAQPLNRFPYYITINGGYRGIIIYRTSQSGNNYLAFERACTNNPGNSCEVIKPDQAALFMVDSCCGSRFRWDGNVVNGPASLPLRQYLVSFVQPNRLIISN